jgi:putative glutamine amidotransferase
MREYGPMIGITPAYDNEKDISSVKGGYYEGIIEAGGMAVLMPMTVKESMLEAVISGCDGLLVTGGPDLDARHYGEANLPFIGEISPLRDSMELCAVRIAFERNIPILGICRGIQVINVALGGTLYQDICSQVRGKDVLKHSNSAPRWYPTHEIMIERDTRIWSAFKAESAMVNSFHHQAVKDAAPGFRVTSRAPDGVIESIEHEDRPFVVGVQWHPEDMWRDNRVYLELFKLFVDSCKG